MKIYRTDKFPSDGRTVRGLATPKSSLVVVNQRAGHSVFANGQHGTANTQHSLLPGLYLPLASLFALECALFSRL